jgi:hypothetical protein
MKTVMKTFMVGETSRNVRAARTSPFRLGDPILSPSSQVKEFMMPMMKGS